MMDTKQSTAVLAGDPSSDQPTDEQMGNAYIFLNDLRSNKQLAQDWDDHLTKASDPKYKIDDKVNYLDNFLADNGYNTTAQAVLTLLKTPWWNDYIASRQPNMQSDRFVQDLLQDSHLYREWGQVIQQSAQDGNLDKADKFLQDNGYACTAIQVNASFQKMRDQNLNYWTNLYGETSLQQDGAKPELGPALIVYGNSTVSVGPDKLFAFKYDQGVVTWTMEGGGGLETNPHSGSITFSQVNQPKTSDSYTGALFSGTITYPDDAPGSWKGAYSYTGRVGDPPDNQPGKNYSPPSVDKGWVSNLADAIQPYLAIGFAIMLLGSGIGATVGAALKISKWIRKKYGESIKENAKKAADKAAEEKPQMPKEEFNSDSTSVRQLQQELKQTSDPVRQADIETEIKQAKSNEDKAQEDAEENLTEDGEQAGKLDDFFEA